jgi:tetratricopeptide (TPR) repeat protein
MPRQLMIVLIRSVGFALVLALCGLCVPTSSAQQSVSYMSEIATIVDEFEQIQASIEVAFRADSYIRSLQSLRYRLKRLDESFGPRPEARYASFALAHTIEDTYLSLIKKMREGNGPPPNETIEQVVALNQSRIQVLKSALKAERLGGGEAGWTAVIETYFELQDYNRAVSMAERAAELYSDSAALLAKLDEVRGRIESIRTNLTEANRLIENKEYRAALALLDELEEVVGDDASVQELRQRAQEALAAVDELRLKALSAEHEGDHKAAYAAWSKVLELEPGNKEALEQIQAYKEKFRIVTRRVYRTCPNCNGTGDCEVCKGSKVCLVCNGFGRCTRCMGRGYYATVCPHCLCQECKGTGRCAVCGGDGLVYCPQCRGKGYFTTKERRTCPLCRGTGKSAISGRACANCGGSGKIWVTVDKPCPRCGGRKVGRCSHCKGSGVCPACDGQGRAETCNVCRGLGRIITECPYCKGTGICLTCDGKGTCRFCKGTGRCAVCAGKRVVVQELEEELLEGEEAGTLAIVTEPSGAQSFFDDDQPATTPTDPRPITPGEHTLRIVKEGYVPIEIAIDADEDSVVEVNVTLLPEELDKLRVLGVTTQRHRMLFKHYTKRDDGSFLASLTINGRNRWVKNGESLLGYRVARLEEITKERYSPRIGATKLLDYSKLFLTNHSGTEVALTLGTPVLVTSYVAKLYDKNYNESWTAREGTRFSGKEIKSINNDRVILIDEDGRELTLPVR